MRKLLLEFVLFVQFPRPALNPSVKPLKIWKNVYAKRVFKVDPIEYARYMNEYILLIKKRIDNSSRVGRVSLTVFTFGLKPSDLACATPYHS